MAQKRPASAHSGKNKRQKSQKSSTRKPAPSAAKTKQTVTVKGKQKAPLYIDIPEPRIEEDGDSVDEGLEDLADGANFLNQLDLKQLSK
jgi:hypothetical protein